MQGSRHIRSFVGWAFFSLSLVNHSVAFAGDEKSLFFTLGTAGGPEAAINRAQPANALLVGADLFVSEMMDIPVVLDDIRRTVKGMPKGQLEKIEWHFRAHHLLPNQVGELAARAGIAKLVVSHIVPHVATSEVEALYLSEIGKSFSGEVVIGNDLDKF